MAKKIIAAFLIVCRCIIAMALLFLSACAACVHQADRMMAVRPTVSSHVSHPHEQACTCSCVSSVGATFSLLLMLAVSAGTASVNILICVIIAAICTSFALVASLMLASDSCQSPHVPESLAMQ
jgi:hypothetical protein